MKAALGVVILVVLIVLGVCGAFAMASNMVSVLNTAVQTQSTQKVHVCHVTQQKRVLIAAVNPSDGELFAIPTVQTVCIIDKSPQGG